MNRAEARCIRQIEKSKLMNLLERERRLTVFLAEHHAEMILKNASKPIEAADAILTHIINHPQVKETDCRINNILDAFAEFQHFSDNIRERNRAAAIEKLETVISVVRCAG